MTPARNWPQMWRIWISMMWFSLGYPNWWYGVPMALLSFLEQNDLSGKEVYLFCSHGTGGLANSVSLITEAAPGAVISDNIFDCYEEDASSSQENIQNWVAELGYAGTGRVRKRRRMIWRVRSRYNLETTR